MTAPIFHSRPTNQRAGSALVLTLIAVVVVMLLMLGYTQLTSNVVQNQQRSVERKRAFYAAEAGLAEGFLALQIGKSGNVGSRDDPAAFGDGLFWVEATEVDDMVELLSTGMVAGGEVTLSMFAKRGSRSVSALGVFSKSPITLNPGTTIDAYDSQKGDYSPENMLATARVLSNGAITASGTSERQTKVAGDLRPGPEATVTQTEYVTITGNKDPLPAEVELPAVELPSLPMSPGQRHSSPTPLVIPPGKNGFEYLTLEADTQVVIQGPATVVIGSVLVNPGAELSFDTSGGRVDLYVTDALAVQATAALTTSSIDPSQVSIQVPGTTVDPVLLAASSSFYGVVYAPEAAISLDSAFKLFGSVVGDSVTFSGASELHFDNYLAEVAAETALPSLVAWIIVDIGNDLVGFSQDPFEKLGVVQGTLRKPADAHQDQWLVIDYRRLDGSLATYEGWESSFDWSDVKAVRTATRDGEPVVNEAVTPANGMLMDK